MTRTAVLSDEVWGRIEAVLPPEKGPMGRPSTPHLPAVEGAIYGYRTGIRFR
jgi:transposase